MLDGKPAPYTRVEVEYYNQDGKSHAPTDYMVTQTIKADGNGVFSYVAPVAGWWGFAALNGADFKLSQDGEEKDVELTHQHGDHEHTEKAHIKVKNIEAITLPEMTDEFAEEYTGGQAKSVADLRDMVWKRGIMALYFGSRRWNLRKPSSVRTGSST